MTTSYKIKLQEDLKAMKRLERAAERAAAEAAEIETAARKAASDARIAQKLSRRRFSYAFVMCFSRLDFSSIVSDFRFRK